MNIRREAFNCLFDEVYGLVENVARALLPLARTSYPVIEFVIWIDFDVLETGEKCWTCDAWITDSNDTDGMEFYLCYTFPTRHDYLTDAGRDTFWQSLKLFTNGWLRGQCRFVDKYGDPE